MSDSHFKPHFWESHEHDAFIDHPERRRHKALAKADETPKAPKHNDNIRAVADSYAQKKGLKLSHAAPILKVNSDRAGKLAQAYDQMKHEPNHPAVKSAYNALIGETADQFHHIKNSSGLKVSRIQPGQENPYKTSADLHSDLKNNNHMWYYPTESGFGTGDSGSDHPLMQDTGHKDDQGNPLLANDMFRVVHDYFGHGKEGFAFGSAGEENAWAHHKQMYSPEAQKALTSETRGQNSWVNFGPHGAHNRANPSQTIFAQQKAGLMPAWANDQHAEPSEQATSLHKSESEISMSKHVFMAYDGDNAGRLVGRAVLANDPKALKEASQRIDHGNSIVSDWVEFHSGTAVSGGGDEGVYVIPTEALDDLEKLRADYEYATQLTMTVGIGRDLSEAGKALMAGKLRGKDQVCAYDDQVEAEIQQEQQAANDGSATGEAKKLGDSYFKDASDESDDHDDCPYCKALEEADDSDPDHCSTCHDDDDDCPYCNDSTEETPEHDPTSPDHADDCPYCQESDEQPEEHDPSSPDHADDCPYCNEAEATPEDQDSEEAESEEVPAEEEEPEQVDAPITNSPHEHTKEGMQQNLDDLINEDDENGSVQAADEDVSDEPVGINMEGNVSRPEGFNEGTPGDMGVASEQTLEAEPVEPAEQEPDDSSEETDDEQQGPNYSQIMQQGMNDHADQIQKERIMTMVAEALQSFKANKALLEQAKDKAPGLYQSNIAMIKAMIEMAKMMGLDKSPEQPAPAAPSSEPEEQGAAPAPKLQGQ